MKKNKSFITVCVITNIIFLIIIVLVCATLSSVTNDKLEKSFPILSDLLEYEEELKNDQYSQIPLRKLKNCSIIVYDSNQKELYSSNKNISNDINSDDIFFINEYYNYEYFLVYDFIKKGNQKKYYIMQVKIDEETETENLIDYATLNENLEVINGTLFGERKQISKFQFELMKGNYNNYIIEKYTYYNSSEEERTLLFIEPQLTAETYEEALKDANRLWLLTAPLIIAILLAEVLLYKRILEKHLEPLKTIIIYYENDKKKKVNNEGISVEFKPIANKFMQLLDKIDKNEVEKNKMIANISHDLKTPLTAIEGYTQAFKDGIVPEEKKEQYLNAIYDKAKIATDLINKLFEYTKLEHPEYKLELQTSDMTQFIIQYLAKKQSEIEMNGFILIKEITKNQCICNFDKALITRLFDNLISNTFKYNKIGTKILFKVTEDKNKIKIIVADDGIGISQEIKESLFEPFVTGNNARPSGGGTGLGMTIAKKIVDLHGGKIELKEKPIKGYVTEFDIEIKKE